MRLTEAVLLGGAISLWAGVLGVFDLLFLLIVPLLFEVVMEEA